MSTPRDPVRNQSPDADADRRVDSRADPSTALRDCRNAIEVIDRRIVALLAERVTLCLVAAQAKRDAALPIVDLAREVEVLRAAQAMAAEAKLPVQAVREIFERIVAVSRRAQQEAR